MQVQTPLGAVYFDGQKRKDLFSSKGEEWKQRRHILTPAFSAHKMKLVMKMNIFAVIKLSVYVLNFQLQMEPLIKQSTDCLAKKIQAFAENKETVEVQG